MNNSYKTTVGLEVHAELNTKSKMFCSCRNNPTATTPNSEICPICAGHPGTLPVANEEAVKKVIKTGLALNCKIAEDSKFDRKNYFYPDLPKGYQISQYDQPIASNGSLKIKDQKSKFKNIRIRRIHLEEDTGSLLHPEGADCSLVNLNRAGVPLMELVTEPDITSGRDARLFAEELQRILRYLDVSSADMEKGEMRVEVNVSLSRPNEKRMRTNDKRIVLADESYNLMGLFFEIHNKLGPIYKEKNYQDAIEEILKREKIPYEREKKLTLNFENLEVSNFFADFIIDNKILIEVKAEKFITQNDIRQTLRYIKSADLPLGIIINFRKDKLEYKRLINPSFDLNSLSFVENSGEVLGTKVEIKNLNSFRVVEKAIEFEIKRQTEILEAGKKVAQETRGWHDKKEITFSQREKEEAHDYRYFPEPDLPKMHFDKSYIEEIKLSMPELPEQRRNRFKKEYGLDDTSIEFFVTNKNLSEYYEKVVSEFEEWTPEKEKGEAHKKASRLVANYLITDIQGLLNGAEFAEKDFKITPENFAEFIKMIYKNEISSKIAKMVLQNMFNTGVDPSSFVDDNNLRQMSDDGELEKIVKEVISKNPKAVQDYKSGKQNALQFLAGQVMSATRGTANPGKVQVILLEFLSK